jgi:transcription antitermination factor NusG
MEPTILSQWYAVYTKPKWEKKVSALLSQNHIPNYCPVNRVLKQWHDRKKWIEEPLFTSYVFVCITPQQQADVRKTAGVLNFVYWLGKPAVIRSEEIDAIRDFLGTHNTIQLEKTRIDVQDQVKIISGPLLHQEGTVVEVRQKVVKVLLPTLGYALVANVEREAVEVVKPLTQPQKTVRI